MNEQNSVVNANETTLQTTPQNDIMPQATQYRSMWNDSEMLAQAWKCAGFLSQTALVPETYRHSTANPSGTANCLIAIDLANRSGLPPLTVMQNLYIVKGKPAWAGQFAIALVNASRRFSRPLRPVFFGEEGTATWGCYMETYDLEGNKVVGSKITMQMAKDEGWIDKSGSKWKTMPEQMLMYRAGAFFARVHCPDVLYGVQMAEEVKDTYGYDENEKPKVTIEI
jgi:hypothetical protein